MSTSVFSPFTGMPGITAEKIGKHRQLGGNGYFDYYPGGMVIDGAKCRDPLNPDYSTDGALAQRRLRAGLLLGKITASGYLANSVIGVSTGALASTGTSLTVSAAEAVELVRRVGATGTFKLTGPPSAAGTVRTLTATYSAVNTTTGAITITALGVNEVQTVNLVTAATGGSIRLVVQKVDGTYALTPAAAWSATDATLLGNLNTALDTATGVAGGIVATAIAATDTDLGVVLTYSGTGYAGNTWALAEVNTLFTSNTGSNVVRTTTGVPGAFVSGSFIQPTDGSETPITFLPPGWEMVIPDDSSNVPLSRPPAGGMLDGSKLLPYAADTSLRTTIRNHLNTYGKFIFTEPLVTG